MIALRAAQRRDKALIRNIFNMYQNELSAYNEKLNYLDAQGYFDVNTVNDILPFGNGVYPYIITDDGRNAGIILITYAPYVLKGCDFCVQELFIIAKLRGGGAAGEAVRAALKGRTGRWCLSVYQKNLRARAFWDKFLRALGVETEVSDDGAGMLNYIFDYTEDLND